MQVKIAPFLQISSYIFMFHNVSPVPQQRRCLCYNVSMNTHNILSVADLLRARLEPVELADSLFDTLEGARPQARKAGVLLGLYEQDGYIIVPFIRRSSKLRFHSGEIAFPGGGAEHTDSSIIQTALREAHEEIGLDIETIEVLGVLHPIFTVVSNYLVVPVVARLPRGLGTVRLQSSEVAELIPIPLYALRDPAIFHTELWVRDGQARTMCFFDYKGYRIWGATARILHTFLATLDADTQYS